MKKLVFLTIVGSLFIGCASKKLSTCEVNKEACLAECKVKYLSDNVKQKLCVTKCYTIYTGCEAKEKAKEGYKKLTN